MKRNLNKAVAALLFASAVITWSLTMWATPPAQGGTLGIASMPKTRAAFAVDGGNRPDATPRYNGNGTSPNSNVARVKTKKH